MLHAKVSAQEGSRTVCAFSVSGLKRINYTLELEHEGYDAIRFKRIAGDLKHYQGIWILEDSPGENETLVVCRMELDSGLPVPGWMVKRSMSKQLSGNLQALKERAESGIADVPPEEKEAPKGEKEKILEVVQRGRDLEIWFTGDHYRSSVRRSIP